MLEFTKNMLRGLIADDFHIKSKSYYELIKRTDKSNVSFIKHNIPKNIVLMNTKNQKLHAILHNLITNIPKDINYNFSHRKMKLIPLILPNLLSSLSACRELQDFKQKKYSNEKLFLYIKKIGFEDDIKIFVAAAIWSIEYYLRIIKQNRINFALVFSGSCLHTSVLLNLCCLNKIPTYLLEHFFTGNDFFVKKVDVPLSTGFQIDLSSFSKEQQWQVRNITEKCLRDQSNRNVLQPLNSKKLDMPNIKTVLILGQVVNDYSLVNSKEGFIPSARIYAELISDLSKLSSNIIFKSHPFERKKSSIGYNFTETYIKSHLIKKLGYIPKNIFFIEDYNLQQVLSQSHFVIGLTSQSLIESALFGLKPIILGQPYFHKLGFSEDQFQLQNMNLFNNHVLMDFIESRDGLFLSLSEYDKLQHFLDCMFDRELHGPNRESIYSVLGCEPISWPKFIYKKIRSLSKLAIA